MHWNLFHMQQHYSPYRRRNMRHKTFQINTSGSWLDYLKSWKFWTALGVSILLSIFLIIYLSLGELRFFASHYFRLGFFNKNYLILLQNNSELRPTGGFITGFGQANVFLGFPGKPDFKNSYEVDTETYVTPPYPHEELLKNEWYEGYTFRDANWSPDFPTSVQQILKFYEQKYPNQTIDGVVAVNFSFIENLIDRLGGIQLNEKTITRHNLFQELEFEVNNIDRHNIEDLSNRKNILKDLATVLMSEMKSSPFLFRDTLVDALNQKEVFMWFKSDAVQAKVAEKGWSNQMFHETGQDFLGFNLSNLGSKKADRYIQPEVNYNVDISGGQPVVNADFVLRYPAQINQYNDNYKGYLRLFIPEGATLISSPVDSREEVEGSFKVVGNQVVLPAGGKTTLSYQYELPERYLANNRFLFKLHKQSGIDVLYKVFIQTTPGKILNSDQLSTRENVAFFNDILKTDQAFSVEMNPDQVPPYPIRQVFNSLEQIEINWSEALDENLNKNQFQITDLNHKNQKTDTVIIDSMKLIDQKTVRLNLSGVTKQNLEAYQLSIGGVTDQQGNLILPNPKKITVIQRLKDR